MTYPDPYLPQQNTFPASLTHLHEMLSWIQQQAKNTNKLHPEQLYKLELACEEVLVNIISYAYPISSGDIVISCHNNTSSFQVIICDQGIPFNPLQQPVDLQTELPPEQRHPGGLGIFLTRTSVDHIEYEFSEGKNTLLLTMNFA